MGSGLSSALSGSRLRKTRASESVTWRSDEWLADPLAHRGGHLLACGGGIEIVVTALDAHEAIRNARLRQHRAVALGVLRRHLSVARTPDKEDARTGARELGDRLPFPVVRPCCELRAGHGRRGGEHRGLHA